MSTFDALATITVGAGGASTIQFTAIPSGYTDLVIKLSARTAASALTDTVLIEPNGSTANMTGRYVQAYNTTVSSGNSASIPFTVNGDTSMANTFSQTEIRIFQYAAGVNKPITVNTATMHSAAGGGTGIQFWSGRLTDTTAITSLTLAPVTSTFKQYTEATLYGIKNS